LRHSRHRGSRLAHPGFAAAIAVSRSSRRRTRSTIGTSIILPSTVTAPTPSASASSRAATTRRAVVDFLRAGTELLVQDRDLARMDDRGTDEAEAA
jgi:hypothetical protein